MAIVQWGGGANSSSQIYHYFVKFEGNTSSRILVTFGAINKLPGMGRSLVFIFLFLFLNTGILIAQSRWDSSYVEEDPEVMVLRTYLSQKYTGLYFPKEDLRYLPNRGVNLGFGFTYQNFTLNAAIPFLFLNKKIEPEYPRFFDFQGHIYPKNWVIDFFWQDYKGYRVPGGIEGGQNYIRPDLEVFKAGVHVDYIVKGDKISLPAAVLQSAIQKKSALSPLVGFEFYRGQVAADSLIFPKQLAPKNNFKKVDFLHLGPNAGLVGTLVLGKGFYASGTFTGNLALESTWNSTSSKGNWYLSWGYHARAYLGYNGPRFGVNVNYVYKTLALQPVENWTQEVQTGNYRLVLVYKIRPSQKFATTFSRYNPARIFLK